MVQINEYYLPPTELIPNSSFPLLHYRGIIKPDDATGSESIAARFYNLLTSNGWRAQWIFRYGQTQQSHYHSFTHECMVVLTGQATIRFGVADTSEDMDANTFGGEWEKGGIELKAQAGDVFIIPAGVTHKTFNTSPADEFALLTPGNGHGVPEGFNVDDVKLSGFTMLGAYPKEADSWNFAVGGEGAAHYAKVWSTPPPEQDPVFGISDEGLTKRWNLPLYSAPRENKILAKI